MTCGLVLLALYSFANSFEVPHVFTCVVLRSGVP